MRKAIKLKNKLTTTKNIWILENRISGSKYLANRLLIMAALSKSVCVIGNLPENEDIRALFKALVQLGYALEWPVNGKLSTRGIAARKKPKSAVTIHCGASGTMARFIVAVAALDRQLIRITGSPRLCQRPMTPLFDALIDLGVNIESNGTTLPASIMGPIKGTRVFLPGNLSSQYASALLLVGSQLAEGLTMNLVGPVVSARYIQMTRQLLQQASVRIEQKEEQFHVLEGDILLENRVLNADPCSASYAMAAAVIAGRELILKPFDYLPEQQGEFGIIDCLVSMGCEIKMSHHQLHLKPPSKIKAINENMSDMPDIVQTLAVVACFAKGVSRFDGISHLRYKESDRIVDTANELTKLGAIVRYGDDWLEVEGGFELKDAEIDSHDDHRMAMSLAQIGWRVENLIIKNPQVVDKSFPNFWSLMDFMGLEQISVK